MSLSPIGSTYPGGAGGSRRSGPAGCSFDSWSTSAMGNVLSGPHRRSRAAGGVVAVEDVPASPPVNRPHEWRRRPPRARAPWVVVRGAGVQVSGGWAQARTGSVRAAAIPPCMPLRWRRRPPRRPERTGRETGPDTPGTWPAGGDSGAHPTPGRPQETCWVRRSSARRHEAGRRGGADESGRGPGAPARGATVDRRWPHLTDLQTCRLVCRLGGAPAGSGGERGGALPARELAESSVPTARLIPVPRTPKRAVAVIAAHAAVDDSLTTLTEAQNRPRPRRLVRFRLPGQTSAAPNSPTHHREAHTREEVCIG